MTWAYPLKWPEGWQRKGARRAGAFKVTFEKTVAELGYEIDRLGGRYPVITSNLETRTDGQPRRDRGEPADKGVSVYFDVAGKQRVFACETFTSVKDNVRAIGLTIAALRSIERYGASDMMDRALAAFAALPPPLDWRKVLRMETWEKDEGRKPTMADVEDAWRYLSKRAHPDAGGSVDRMKQLNEARALAKQEIG